MAMNSNVVAEQNASIAELVHTPTFLVVAGALPGLYVATTLQSGAVIGAVIAVSIVAAAVLSRAVTGFTGSASRVAATLMLSATVAVILGFAVRVADPVTYESMGLYLPVACASGMASLFIAQGGIASDDKAAELTVKEAVFSAVCAFLALAFCGLMTGMFATGEIFGLTMEELASSPISIFGKPAGSLLLLALVAVFVQSVCDARAPKDASEERGGEH